MSIKKINNIYVTKNVTFPRSGHHMLISILSSYFEERLNYCEMYHTPNLTIENCEFTNYQKTHDFELKEPILTNVKYLIQLRNFDDACLSYYRLSKFKYNAGVERPIKNPKPEVDINSPEYLAWQKKTYTYYFNFVNKWTMNPIPNSKIIYYENLISNPIEQVSSVISFITDEAVNYDKLNLIIKKSDNNGLEINL